MVNDESNAVRIANEKTGRAYDFATVSNGVSHVLGMKVWRLHTNEPLLGAPKAYIAADGTCFNLPTQKIDKDEYAAAIQARYDRARGL